MCLTPVFIDNPNSRTNQSFLSQKILSRMDSEVLAGLRPAFDDSPKIPVPCGHCKQCIALKSIYMVQRVQVESVFNHLFYGTLTYNNDMLPRYRIGEYAIPFADISDFQNMIKRINANNSFGVPFRVFAVSERGSEKGRPHFHCIILVPKFYARQDWQIRNLEWRIKTELLANWTRNVGSTRNPYYLDLCTYKERIIHNRLYRNYDLHYIAPNLSKNGCADVAFYVLKYMLKPSDKEARLQQALHLNLSEEDYEIAWPILKSKTFHSFGFGLNASMFGRKVLYDPEAVKLVRNCVDFSDKSLGYPCFFNPDTGASSPLGRWYRSVSSIWSASDQLAFYKASGCPDPFVESVDPGIVQREIDSFMKIREVADLHSYDDIITNF